MQGQEDKDFIDGKMEYHPGNYPRTNKFVLVNSKFKGEITTESERVMHIVNEKINHLQNEMKKNNLPSDMVM